MDALYIALVVAVIGPVILSWLTGRQRRAEKTQDAELRRAEKEEDWKRQDDVAAQAAEAAALLLQRQDAVAAQAAEAAELLLASNKEIADAAAEATKITSAKLEVIRIDVNSNMTAAMQAELDATEAQVVLMREVIDLKKSAGREPSTEAQALLKAKELRINELKATLKDRLTAAGGE